jgi:DNA-binding transcriptional ArsR family regulator
MVGIMTIKKLLSKKSGHYISKDILVSSEIKEMRSLTHKIRWDILKMLSKKPMYPIEISESLGIHEQRVYYHIRQLEKSGMIKVAKTEEVRGGMAKYYAPAYPSFGVELPFGESKIKMGRAYDQKVMDFFSEFNDDGKFDGIIVVGSPDPHGPQKQRARDGHYVGHLGMFLGQFFDMPESNFVVKLDIDVKSEKAEKNNMILLGGPVSNLITGNISKHLPVTFGTDHPWQIVGKKTYSDESCGLVAKIDNPFAREKKIIVIGGVSAVGTKSAIIGITRFWKDLLRDYSGSNFSRILQGFDIHGDGKIDSVEILE